MTARTRLLLVDDNAVDRELIRRCLGPYCDTAEASTGREALLALADPVDCALIDYRLPDVDGLTLLPQFVERDVPVVMLTGQGDETLAVEAMKRGALDYLSKGKLDRDTLQRAVAHAIDKKTLQRRIDQQQDQLRARVREVEEQRAELERSNAALRQREAKLRVALEQLPAIVWTTDTALHYTSVAGLRWRALAAEPSQLLGAPLAHGFADGDVVAAMLSAHEAALSGQRSEFEVRLGDATYQVYIEALHDESGNTIGAVGLAIDVSSTRLLEQQLRVAQKMEALGKLAGGVAHDFNNVLTAIVNFTSFARDALDVDSPVRIDLGEVLHAADRAARLVRQLLAFSRQGASDPRTVQAGDVVGNMLSMLRRTVGEDVEIRFQADSELWNTRIAPACLEQITVNLVVNARDAMPRGGRIDIRVCNVTVTEELAIGRCDLLQPGEYVRLSVTDTGTGIPAELLDRIFDPFFTTKELGVGTGLGLATCYGIVGQAGGKITVNSELERGTSFEVYLARSLQAADPPQQHVESEASSGGETILVVEDEAQVRALAIRALRAHGYQVFEAAKPSAALQLCDTYSGTIDLVLTDVVMPEMTGVDLIARVRQLRPNIAVLYMSGYTSSLARDQGLVESHHALLDKPFTPALLTRRIRDVLTSNSPAIANARLSV